MSYQANKDRSYNTFDKAELNSAEKMHMKQWAFIIPEELEGSADQRIIEQGNDHEIQIDFKEKGKILLLKSAIPIPHCTQFRYFEVDVIENKIDASIFVGIIEENDPFFNSPESIDSLNGL